MINKLKLSFCILIVLVMVLFIISFYRHSIKTLEKLEYELYILQENIYSHQDKIESLLFADSLRMVSNNFKIETDFYLYQDNDSIKLKDLLKTKKKSLVFKYSELNCQLCVDKEIKALKEFSNSKEKDVIILSNYKSMRDLFLFIRTNQIPDMKIYNMKYNKLGLFLEKFNTPFYFTIDTSNFARNVFIPEKLFPERSKLYLKAQLKQ